MNNIRFENSTGESIELFLRPLKYEDIPVMITLQDLIISRLNPAIFQPSFDYEIMDAIDNDYCCGLFDGDELAAFCITVFNRETSRNYCALTDEPEAFSKYFSFDSIQVKEKYRGFGIQRFFLDETERLAKERGAEYMLATVSPENKYSLRHFIDMGYEIYKNREINAYNSIRYLMIKLIEQSEKPFNSP